MPTVSGQPAYLSGRPAPWPPIDERQPLRSPPFFNRRLHPKPTVCVSISHSGAPRAHWEPPRRFAGASTSRPATLRVGSQSAHLFRTVGMRPPIPSVLAFPQAPAPGGTNRRRDLHRPLRRSPGNEFRVSLDYPARPFGHPYLPVHFPPSNDRQDSTFPTEKFRAEKTRFFRRPSRVRHASGRTSPSAQFRNEFGVI